VKQSKIEKKLKIFDKVLKGGIKPFKEKKPDKPTWTQRKDAGKNTGGWMKADEYQRAKGGWVPDQRGTIRGLKGK